MWASLTMRCNAQVCAWPACLCLRNATSHVIVMVVVDKQLRYETYIVPVLRINNIAVLMGSWYCAVRNEDLAAEERILNHFKACCPKQKDGCSLEKKGSTSYHINSSHSCWYSRYCTLCCCCMSKELYLQLVFHCITGVAGSGLGSYCATCRKTFAGPRSRNCLVVTRKSHNLSSKSSAFCQKKDLASKKLCKMSEGRWVFEKLCKKSEVKCCLWKTQQSVRRKTALW